MRELTFGHSPCPNDTFAFHALTHGLIDVPYRITPVLLDIEELLQVNLAILLQLFDSCLRKPSALLFLSQPFGNTDNLLSGLLPSIFFIH